MTCYVTEAASLSAHAQLGVVIRTEGRRTREREREEKKNNGSINSSTSLDAAFYKISRKDPVPELFELLFIVTLLNVSDEAISRVTARERDGIRVQVFVQNAVAAVRWKVLGAGHRRNQSEATEFRAASLSSAQMNDYPSNWPNGRSETDTLFGGTCGGTCWGQVSFPVPRPCKRFSCERNLVLWGPQGCYLSGHDRAWKDWQ